MNKDDKLDNVLCCPLCGSDEYLLSDNDSMLCAGCGSFFENVTQLRAMPTLHHRVGTVAAVYSTTTH